LATTIKIGHASSNERGEANGGTPGDQKQEQKIGEEVGIVDNYDVSSRLSPDLLLRPVSKALAENSALACEAGCKNVKIGYAQDNRNTLYIQAVAKNYKLADITTACDADCASFMSVCAKAGGATFSYGLDGGSNAPNCTSMKRWFTSTDEYKAITSDKYLKSTDYLKRGDILVNSNKHTVMVLENGSKIPKNSDIKISMTVKTLQATKATIELKVQKVLDNGETTYADASLLSAYLWSYELVPLQTGISAGQVSITVSNMPALIELQGLGTNVNYGIRISAMPKSGDADSYDESLGGQMLIFKTKQSAPTKITNITTTFDDAEFSNKQCVLAFNAPESWGGSGSKGYSVSLIVNGKILNTNDSLITNTGATRVEKSFKLSSIMGNNSFNYSDSIQIGVRAWIKNGADYVYDSDFPTCSSPVYISSLLTCVDKAYIKLNENAFKQVILHPNITL
jgi:hypothetical protein